MTFSVSPQKYINIRVKRSETGMVIPMISVGLMDLRKIKRMRTASRAP
jgi:hypothetical protein